MTLQLCLFHGRNNPDEHLDDWGFDGPVIPGIAGVSATYGMLRVTFSDQAACKAAKALTGWSDWDELTLEMATHEDLVRISTPTGNQYFGDWSLSTVCPS